MREIPAGPERVARLFERHHLALYRYLVSATGSVPVAEDVTQDVFLRALRGLPDDPAAHERAWLYTTARHLVLNRRRDLARRGIPEELPELPARAAPAADAFDLHEALDRLDAPERDLLLMRELGGLGYEELSKVFDLTPDAVRSRLHRLRLSLRNVLTRSWAAGTRPGETEIRHE
jgi:RNA polymerase sigma-70 factor (ECF subfamily)